MDELKGSINDKVKEIEALTAGLNEEEKEERKDFNLLYKQIFAVAGPILLTVCGGMVTGYSAILLPQLDEDDSIIKVTKNQETWIASMAPLPMAIGCFVCGWSMDYMGRKRTNLFGAFLMLVGWLCIYLATSVEWLLIGRLITGYCVGAIGGSGTAYIAEISHVKYRGMFLAAISLGIAIGILITHILGTFLFWKTVALIILAFPILTLIILIKPPESHVWYAKKGKIGQAREAFKWFRGDTQEANLELMNILNSPNQKQFSFKELIHECRKSRFVKPLLILILFFSTMQLSGNNAVVFYSVSIMQSTVSSLDRYVAMLIIDVLRVIMSVVACILTKKFRVRPLSIISGLGTSFSLYFLSLFVFLSSLYPSNLTYKIIPMISLITYVIFMSIGLVPLPWSLCGEILHPNTRGIGSGISTSINFIMFFTVVKTSPDLFDNLGTPGTFVTYASLCLLGTGILYFVLPETKNKTLKDIEEYFVGKKGKGQER